MKGNKYLTFSFDDGEIYDRVLCDMLRKYGMKATFYLISDQLGFKCDFHRYGEHTVVERVSSGEIRQTYKDMEVATHTANHRFLLHDFEDSVQRSADELSRLCGYEVTGLAYPGGEYTDECVERLKRSDIRYARAVQSSYRFDVPTEWYAWQPTLKYDDERIFELADEFLAYEGENPIIFHIWGHSYEMTRKEQGCGFSDFERLLRRLSNREDVTYATNGEIREVLTKK